MSQIYGPDHLNEAAGHAALAFAMALANGDFDSAHAMLSLDAAERFPPTELKRRFEKMVSYWPVPADECQVIDVAHDQELLRLPDEIAWAYVAIHGPGYAEAVTVTLTTDLKVRIGEYGWGRP